MRAKRHIAPSYEASLGPAIAWAIAQGGHTDEFEVDGVFFTFDIDSQPDETETVYTGVTFLGDRESYLKTTHKARIKYNGAYTLREAPWWDPYGDTRDVEIDLDMNLLARCIEEQSDDCSEFVISLQ